MKLLLLFLFSLTTILSESFPQNKMVREKRQSTFLEGLGGPLALKPHAGKNDTINRTASTAEAMPSQTTTKTVPITTKTTTTRMTTTAPIRTTEATKIKELKAKHVYAVGKSTYPSSKADHFWSTSRHSRKD
ncbi:hypothetical protein D918_04493 [Trichuris suis]|nr:hypothetical protein D918_04493 [Trichuris suis]